jgi:L-lactate dehydrogenase complex protein LldG
MADGTGDPRSAILGRIGAANRDADAEMRRGEYEMITREYRQRTSMERPEILKLFTERLRDYDAQVHGTTQTTVGRVISEVAHHVIIAQGFPRQWLPENCDWRWEADADLESLDSTVVAIAACEAAIAHTGTVILRDLRKLTLLPDRLLCVVREDQVFETVPEAIERLQPFAATALTFISGPSATADIEMTRIRGVHGPRFLDVLLVENG